MVRGVCMDIINKRGLEKAIEADGAKLFIVKDENNNKWGNIRPVVYDFNRTQRKWCKFYYIDYVQYGEIAKTFLGKTNISDPIYLFYNGKEKIDTREGYLKYTILKLSLMALYRRTQK